MTQVDLNCDVGEGVGNETDLFPHISSCNIACGGHAGDWETMLRVSELALNHGVKIGAHPSYPDRHNFGRKSLKISLDVLADSILSQIDLLESVLFRLDAGLHHIKAHGALYNDLAQNITLAEFYLNTLNSYKDKLMLYVPYDSALAILASKMGFTIWLEGFADRRYLSSGTLAPRSSTGSLITTPELVWQQLKEMIANERVKCIDGNWIKIKAHTFCVHGDTPNASEIIEYLSNRLNEESIATGF